jgi:hypothetical protein
MANPTKHANAAMMRKVAMPSANGAAGNAVPLQPRDTSGHQLHHPMPHVNMWRGQHNKYRYNQATPARYGEGEAKNSYHQYFSHAKCPEDYNRGLREFELINVRRGKLVKKPMPVVQYVGKDAKPTWLFKTWHDALQTTEPWQREVQYEAHTPTHLGAKRPLSVLAPKTMHKHMHLAWMEKVTITCSPLLFGFGFTLQKTVLDFYRRCISGRSMFPKDKVFLFYSVDAVAPRIEVTWMDGTTYSPVILDGAKPQDLIQSVMEAAWLQGDRMEAAGTKLPPLAIDDYKWQEVLSFKRKKKVEAAGKKKK